jgi:hypothetical protein
MKTTDAKEADRVPIGFRVTPDLKAQIEDAARTSGRSQAQELELMIERSFERRALLPELLETIYGSADAALLLTFGEVMRLAGRTAKAVATGEAGDDWLSSPAAFEQVKQGIVAALDAYRPQGDATLPAQFSKLGAGVASTLVEETATGISRTPAQDRERAATLHVLGGSAIEAAMNIKTKFGKARRGR